MTSLIHGPVALIPAYEPPTTFPALIDKLRPDFNLIVVDDGSSPAAAPVFQIIDQTVHLLRHETNQGKGAALITGLTWIKDHYPPNAVVVTVDADGQHRPDDVRRVVAACQPGTVVLGVRRDDATTPPHRRVAHAFSRLAFRLVSGTTVSDTQTGLRAFHVDLIPKLLRLPGERYEWEMNMLLFLIHDHIPIIEVDIATVYLESAVSHYRNIQDSGRIARHVLGYVKARKRMAGR